MSKYEERITALERVARAEPPPRPATLTLGLTKGDIIHLHKLPNMRPELLLQVIGYLTTYAQVAGYATAFIYRDRNDIMATYRREPGRSFVMCACWDEYTQKWSTHP